MDDAFWLGGAYHVEPSLNRVTGPNGAVRLEPKVMQVLVCLAGHPGRMVPKERILQAAWPDTAVSDDVLTRAISELRRLLDDDAKQAHVIETIPKSGYRLIAPVHVNGALVDALPSCARPRRTTRQVRPPTAFSGPHRSPRADAGLRPPPLESRWLRRSRWQESGCLSTPREPPQLRTWYLSRR